MATIWTLPDGSQVMESTEMCPACGHEHSPMMGGICIGCPCEAWPQRQVESPPPALQPEGESKPKEPRT